MTNRFVWYELTTNDVEAAAAFYGAVVGWNSVTSASGGGYVEWQAGERRIGGLMAIPAEARDAGARPGWLGYISVDDADATAAEIVAAGGTVHMDIKDIPGVGRIAMAADPQGAHFYIIAPVGEGEAEGNPMAAGSVGWHELHTSGWQDGFDFYARLFGWARDEALDMGPMGTYQLFRAGGDNPVGGMFDADTFGRPAWLYYFVVTDIDAAGGRVRSGGGEVLKDPMEVPGGAWVVECRDPQGASFALVGTRNSQGDRR